MFKIMTDSISDLPSGFIRQENIDVLFVPYKIEGRIFNRNYQMDPVAFYNKMREGFVPETFPVTFEEARTAFGQVLKTQPEILYISFSSKMSQTFENVQRAARELNRGVDGAKIIVIDTKAASLGQGLIVYQAARMRKEGATIDEVAKYIEQNLLSFSQIMTVDSPGYLYRGNRIKKSSLIMCTLTGLRPILHIDAEGAYARFDLIRGRKSSLLYLVDFLEAHMKYSREDNEIIGISHCDCEADAEFVAEEIRRRFGFERIMIQMMEPAIGAHTGPGTIGLFFRGNKR